MATFPAVKFDWRDLTETPDSVVQRQPMERGIPKQRRIASDVRMEIGMTLHFDTKVETASFETFFFDTLHAGQDWFDFVHPRTGATVQARIVDGTLGALKFLDAPRQRATRSLKIEYWRSAW